MTLPIERRLHDLVNAISDINKTLKWRLESYQESFGYLRALKDCGALVSNFEQKFWVRKIRNAAETIVQTCIKHGVYNGACCPHCDEYMNEQTTEARANNLAMRSRLRYVAYPRKHMVQCVAIETADKSITHFVMDEARGNAIGQLIAMFTNKNDCVLFWRAANQQHFSDHRVFVALGEPEGL